MSGFLILFIVTSLSQAAPGVAENSKAENPLIYECGRYDNSTAVRLSPAVTRTVLRNYNFQSQRYRSHENCHFRLLTGDHPLLLTLTFNIFDVELEPECRFDFLCVTGVRLCGSWLEKKIYKFLVPAANVFTISFTTDGSFLGRGFEIFVDAKPAEGQTVQKEMVSGPGSAENLVEMADRAIDTYTDRCRLTYTNIPPAPGYGATDYVYVTDNKDIVAAPNPDTTVFNDKSNNQFTDVTNDNDRSINQYPEGTKYEDISTNQQTFSTAYDANKSRYPDSNLSNDWTTTSQHHHVTDDLSQTSSHYNTGIYDSTIYRNNTDYPHDVITSQDVSLTTLYCNDSSVYPVDVGSGRSSYQVRNGRYDYDKNTSCAVEFRTENIAKVFRVTVSSTNLDYGDHCQGSTLCVKNARFCGYWSINTVYSYVVPPLKTFTVAFTSDQHSLLRSFTVTLETEDAAWDSVFHEVSGGAFPNALYYQWTDNRNYKDNCSVSYRETTYSTAGYVTLSDYTSQTTLDQYGTAPDQTTPHEHGTTPDQIGTTPVESGTTPGQYQTTLNDYGATPNQYRTTQDHYGTTPDQYGTDSATDLYCNDSTVYQVDVGAGRFSYQVMNGRYDYTKNTSCAIEFRTENIAKVFHVTFRTIYLDFDNRCHGSSLCVKNALFCGTTILRIAYSYVVPPHQTFTVAFTSGERSYRRSFNITLETEDASWDSSFNEVSGGAFPNPLYYQWTDNHNYKDNCSFSYRETTSSTDYNSQTTPDQYGTTPEQYGTDSPTTVLCDSSLYREVVYIGDGSYTYTVQNKEFGHSAYGNSDYCAIEFSNLGTAKIFNITFNYLDVQYDENCRLDKLCVKNVDFCGDWQMNFQFSSFSYLVPPDKTFSLVFSSDASVPRYGFQIEVHIEDADQNTSLYEVSGGVGSNPSKLIYQRSDAETYTDTCSPSYHAATTSSYHGTSNKNDVTTYRTDHSKTLYCYTTLYSLYVPHGRSSYIIQNEPTIYGTYNNNEHCSVQFRVQETPQILNVTFNFFNVEDSDSCEYDALCVKTAKFCNSWETGHIFSYLVPAYKTFTVSFTSDAADRFDGYSLTVDIEDAQSVTSLYEVTGGVGSSADHLQYGWSSMDNYVDSCAFSYQTTSSPMRYVTKMYDSTTATDEVPILTDSVRGTTDDYNVTSTGNTMVEAPVDYCWYGATYIYTDNANSSYIVRSSGDSDGTAYDNNQLCSVAFKTQDIPLLFTLTFNSFDVEPHQTCLYDHLCIHGVKFCGYWATGHSFRYIVPANQTFSLTFSSDNSKTGNGFEIKVDTESLDSHIVINEASSGYGSSAQTIIYKHSDQQAYIDSCHYSDIWDRNSPTPQYSADSQSTYVTSDPRRTTAIDENTWTPAIYCTSVNDVIDVRRSHDVSSFLVLTNGFGDRSYDDNDSCSVMFRTANTSLLFTITFKDFDLEYDLNCNKDWLCIGGVRFCGHWAEGRNFSYAVPSYSSFTIKFHSDSDGVRKGFQIAVTAQDIQDTYQQYAQLAGGFVSQESMVQYSWVNIYNYQDKCGYASFSPETEVNSTELSNPNNSGYSKTSRNNDFTSNLLRANTPQTAPVYGNVSTPYPRFLSQQLHLIQWMVEDAQNRLSKAYDLLTSLF